jgi:hypothetical protein
MLCALAEEGFRSVRDRFLSTVRSGSMRDSSAGRFFSEVSRCSERVGCVVDMAKETPTMVPAPEKKGDCADAMSGQFIMKTKADGKTQNQN